MEACRCKWSTWKMAEVQCRSLLVTERRTVRTIVTPRHSPFISRHRQMKNHCESATSVCINITKPQRKREGEVERGRERPYRLSFSNLPKVQLCWIDKFSMLFSYYYLFFFFSFFLSSPLSLGLSYTHTHSHRIQTVRTDVEQPP